jgi:small acid-soluble spore protein H (minor)
MTDIDKGEVCMDKERAEAIVASPTMINVTYHGIPVYIENVNQQSANIHTLDRPGSQQIVLLKDLVEI